MPGLGENNKMTKRIEIERVENGFVVIDNLSYNEVVYVAKTKEECSKILTKILKEQDEKVD